MALRRTRTNRLLLVSVRAIAGGMVVALAATIPRGAASFTAATAGNGSIASGTWCVPGSPGALTPVADAYVQEDKESENFGNDPDLIGRSTSAGKNARILVKFNLPAIPPGCTITAASLTLTTVAYTSGRTYDVRRAAGGWSENSVDWDSQPGSTGSLSSAPSAASTVTWDVTAQIVGSYPTDRGLEIRDSVEYDAGNSVNRFSSREGATAPTLTVTFG